MQFNGKIMNLKYVHASVAIKRKNIDKSDSKYSRIEIEIEIDK